MAAQSGEPDFTVEKPSLPELLQQDASDFSFFQAVRLLQREAGGREPVGSFLSPATEPVRFASHLSLAFPVAEIESLVSETDPRSNEDQPPKMTVNFFGLHGPSGVLPTRLTEMMIERSQARDRSLRDFLDLFNHRMISLLYRAWEKYRFPVAYERSRDDAFTGYMLDFIGLGTSGLRNRQAVPDEVLICYEGLLAQFPRSAAAFRLMLAHYFEVPVEIEPFAGTWRPLDAGSRTCLSGGFSRSEQLGIGIVLGDEIWDQQSVVRVKLGPMTLERYKSFLPDGDAHAPLKALARFFCGDDIDVEAQLILKREEVPRASLDAEDVPAPRLGWISWMFTRSLDRDPDETILRLWEM
jgi:type VI secretion system protein ImpH